MRVGPTEVSSSENPYAPNALDPSDHEPGVLLVTYYSKEAMGAASQENVRETSPVYYPNPSYTLTLYFEDTANIADPDDLDDLDDLDDRDNLDDLNEQLQDWLVAAEVTYAPPGPAQQTLRDDLSQGPE